MNKLKRLAINKPKISLSSKHEFLHRDSHHIESPEKEFHNSKLGVHALNLWEKDLFTDVSIKCIGKVYHAHRPVLSCYSTYFKKHNPNRDNNIVQLDGLLIKPETFEILLRYMYTGDLDITVQNIGDIYTASRKLGIKKALNLCKEVLTGKIKHDLQCIYVYTTAKTLNEINAIRRSLEIMGRHFERIIGTQEFLDLSFDEIMEYLSFEQLNIRSEMVVYLAALKWLNHKPMERQVYVERVLSCVRFPLMSLNEVVACFSPPILPGIIKKPVVEYMLLKATCFIASKVVNEENRFKRYSCKPRKYLIQQEPLLVWDPNIFYHKRYAQYKKEIAATKIQSGFRAQLARREKRRLQYLRDTKMLKNCEKTYFGEINQKYIKNDIRKNLNNSTHTLNQELMSRINRVARPSSIDKYYINAKQVRENHDDLFKASLSESYYKNLIELPIENINIAKESSFVSNDFEKFFSNANETTSRETNCINNVLSVERNRECKILPGEMFPVTGQFYSKKNNIDRLLPSETSFTVKESSSETACAVRKSRSKTFQSLRDSYSETFRIIKKSLSNTSRSVKKSLSNTSRSVKKSLSKISRSFKESPSKTSREHIKLPKGTFITAPISEASVFPYRTDDIFEQKPTGNYNADQILVSEAFNDENSLANVIKDFTEVSPTDKSESANKDMAFELQQEPSEELIQQSETDIKVTEQIEITQTEKQVNIAEPYHKGLKQFNCKISMKKQTKEAGNVNTKIEKRIILLGGCNPENIEDMSAGETMVGYNPNTDKWIDFGTLPVSRHNMCAAYCDSCIYIIGGSELTSIFTTGVKPVNDCRKFQLRKKNWVKISSMCSARIYHGVTVVKDIIYVVGGVDENYKILDTIEWYNVEENKWTVLKCKLRIPKMAVAVCAYRSNLWIAGGMSDEHSEREIVLFKDVEVYNPRRNEMQNDIADLPSPRTYISLVECNKSIYCVGGATILNEIDESISSLNEVYVYADHLNAWVPSTSLPLPRHSMAVISFGDIIYVINGLSTSVTDMLNRDVSVFDPKANKWTNRTPLSSVNDGICAVSIPADLFEKAKKQ